MTESTKSGSVQGSDQPTPAKDQLKLEKHKSKVLKAALKEEKKLSE